MEVHKENKYDKSKKLINSIKSRNIFKQIFSFIDDDLKLKLIIYNKKIQNVFKIDIDYIKEKSGKIKFYEKNGTVKVYSLKTNKLIFERHYLNGKKQGKGTEYYENGYLKFKGKFLNGKKIYGKGYNLMGNIILKIEKNGK